MFIGLGDLPRSAELLSGIYKCSVPLNIEVFCGRGEDCGCMCRCVVSTCLGVCVQVCLYACTCVSVVECGSVHVI